MGRIKVIVERNREGCGRRQNDTYRTAITKGCNVVSWEIPNRTEENENEVGYQAMLMSLDWNQGNISQHLVVKVDRSLTINLKKNTSSKSFPMLQKTLP